MNTPRTVYRVYLGKIDQVTVLSEATQFVRLQVTGAFGTQTIERAKKGGWQAKIYESWEDAHARLVEDAEHRVDKAKAALADAFDDLETARNVRKP